MKDTEEKQLKSNTRKAPFFESERYPHEGPGPLLLSVMLNFCPGKVIEILLVPQLSKAHRWAVVPTSW